MNTKIKEFFDKGYETRKLDAICAHNNFVCGVNEYSREETIFGELIITFLKLYNNADGLKNLYNEFMSISEDISLHEASAYMLNKIQNLIYVGDGNNGVD